MLLRLQHSWNSFFDVAYPLNSHGMTCAEQSVLVKFGAKKHQLRARTIRSAKVSRRSVIVDCTIEFLGQPIQECREVRKSKPARSLCEYIGLP